MITSLLETYTYNIKYIIYILHCIINIYDNSYVV